MYKYYVRTKNTGGADTRILYKVNERGQRDRVLDLVGIVVDEYLGLRKPRGDEGHHLHEAVEAQQAGDARDQQCDDAAHREPLSRHRGGCHFHLRLRQLVGLFMHSQEIDTASELVAAVEIHFEHTRTRCSIHVIHRARCVCVRVSAIEFDR